MKRLIPICTLVACAIVAVAIGAAAGKSENEKLVKGYVDAWNTGDVVLLDAIVDASFARYGPAAEFTVHGLANMKQYLTSTRDLYEDFKVSMGKVKDHGDRVVLGWTVRAEYAGAEHPESVGEKIKIKGTSVYRIADGKITEERASWDFLDGYEQLGFEGPISDAMHNTRIARDFVTELYQKGNEAIVYEILSPEFVFHVPASDTPVRGQQAAQARAAMFRRAFPDIRFTFEDVVAEGDTVAMRWVFTGTHRGEFLGVAPTNRKIEIGGLSITRVEAGRITESWGVWDTGEMMTQLGAAGP